MEKVFTFWEGKMPEYIKLCMETWHFTFTQLNYKNLNNYTNLPIERLEKFTLPQIADIVRVHVLRDNGGYWLDADTIVLDKLPTVEIMGRPQLREASIGFLRTEVNSEMYVKWAEHQKKIYMSDEPFEQRWDLMGNLFINSWIKENPIEIGDISFCWPEDYMKGGNDRWTKYRQFYFKDSYHLKEIKDTRIIMLHNSWTPEWYKNLPRGEVLRSKCTLSNFLKEAKL